MVAGVAQTRGLQCGWSLYPQHRSKADHAGKPPVSKSSFHL